MVMVAMPDERCIELQRSDGAAKGSFEMRVKGPRSKGRQKAAFKGFST